VRRLQKKNVMCLAAISSAASLLITACTGPLSALGSATPAVSIPAPAMDEPAGTASDRETALLAGGCFWGMQGVFEHVSNRDDHLAWILSSSPDRSVGIIVFGHLSTPYELDQLCRQQPFIACGYRKYEAIPCDVE
jgi:hypothetical protein